ncbi:hypothetical protein [Amycolatopsis sp. NPDC051061]|uniref:hypothetical protein n=1 Tax=Amycolatopsis sp. NPDC051061 TaxID=3155042 RepID=UPI0034427E0E
MELPGGVLAWSVTSLELAKRVLGDEERFAKDAHQHWPALINGEIPQAWPLIGWLL